MAEKLASVLDNQWTGATDIMVDPRNSKILYAATWDRHRTVAALMSGGPGSGIHKSTDGGETWQELENGLPTSNMGKIGLAISPQNPDVIYAAIELDRTTEVYSDLKTKELLGKKCQMLYRCHWPSLLPRTYASPHKFDLYLMNVRVLTSEDGGKTFVQLSEKRNTPTIMLLYSRKTIDYLMLGTDARIYESFDLAKNWRYHKISPLHNFTRWLSTTPRLLSYFWRYPRQRFGGRASATKIRIITNIGIKHSVPMVINPLRIPFITIWYMPKPNRVDCIGWI